MSDEISESFCQEIIKQYEKNSLQRPVYVIQEHHATRLHWDLVDAYQGAYQISNPYLEQLSEYVSG